MELDFPMQLEQPLFFCKDFSQNFGVCQWEFVPIQPKEHLAGEVLMLDETVWVVFNNVIHPKGVQWGQGTKKAI